MCALLICVPSLHPDREQHEEEKRNDGRFNKQLETHQSDKRSSEVQRAAPCVSFSDGGSSGQIVCARTTKNIDSS
eukprot:SAG31_NODE_197_length_20660_cov_8.861368_3_plen_75_part_00